MDTGSLQQKSPEEIERQKILRKRTLQLGEVDSSDEESATKVAKTPSTEISTRHQDVDWRTRASVSEPLISTASSSASGTSIATVCRDVIEVEGEPGPITSTPDVA